MSDPTSFKGSRMDNLINENRSLSRILEDCEMNMIKNENCLSIQGFEDPVVKSISFRSSYGFEAAIMSLLLPEYSGLVKQQD